MRSGISSGLMVRLTCAGVLLGIGLAGLALATRFGVVHLNAGDTSLVFAPGSNGLSMAMTQSGCPPECGVGVNWRPLSILRPGKVQ